MEEWLTMHVLPEFKQHENKEQPCTCTEIPCGPLEGGHQLAEAYVYPEKFCGILPPTEGLIKGTVFEQLFKPYEGWQKRYAEMGL